MMRRSLVATALFLVFLASACAGDVATFVNLGFSADSAYFMFGQYGIDAAAGKPYAETYLVDNRKNDFVPKGVARRTFDSVIEPGQETTGAIFSLYGEQIALVKKYKIDNLKPGRLLYVLMDGQEPPASLSFRDFKTGANYEISLNQSSSAANGAVMSSFGVAVSCTDKGGQVKRVVGGNPDIKRGGVKAYVIRRIFIAPDEKTLVFIVEKRTVEKGDPGVRYMVEALRLP
jgi:predicted secreted protein